MHSSPTTIVMHPPLLHTKRDHEMAVASGTAGGVIFDSSTLRHQATSTKVVPNAFVWPRCDRTGGAVQELDAPVVDLEGFLRRDEESTMRAADLIRDACTNHGFFQVINHGVGASLVRGALDCTSEFFGLPLCDKLQVRRRPGSMWGYSGAHSDRFTSNLPWKETMSFDYHDDAHAGRVVADYFASSLGQHFARMGSTYQKYCEAMKSLSQEIMELLAISLGVAPTHYRDFFKGGKSIMRCNYYPPCEEPELTLGTGPHCDPTSLTILQQDDVDGLEVFTGGKWQSVRPVSGALVINIGDTFMALSNGRFKSCLHRAVVNRHRARRSLAFFVCPPDEAVIRPPPAAEFGHPRLYPDFTWSQFMEFTQRHYRADVRTLSSFVDWLLPKSSPSILS